MPIDVWAHVIMPEHVHLLFATPFPLVRACHPTAKTNLFLELTFTRLVLRNALRYTANSLPRS